MATVHGGYAARQSTFCLPHDDMPHILPPHTGRRRAFVATALFATLAACIPASAAGRGVIVNGMLVDPELLDQLEKTYRTPIVANRYWYDARAGLWGLEGGPSSGRIAPGVPLPGTLDPRASVGRLAGITGVVINGREIHPEELKFLRTLYNTVNRARYWLNADGVGGYENGPPLFNLNQAIRARAAQLGGQLRIGLFGTIGSDGQCSYYLHPNGPSTMTGNC